MAAQERGWAQYQIRRTALDAAAMEAAAGHLEGVRPGDAFAGVGALARAAQAHWWHGLFGRLDAVLDDDLDSMAPGDRQAAVCAAWGAQNLAMPGYLALAQLGVDDAGVQADRGRYARLLALFAGRAGLDEGHQEAAVAGLQLVAELAGDDQVAAPEHVNCFTRV